MYPGNYSVHMIARDESGGIFSRTVFNLEKSAGRWNQFTLYYIVPKATKRVSMLVSVKNQERGARFHVDDFFIDLPVFYSMLVDLVFELV